MMFRWEPAAAWCLSRMREGRIRRRQLQQSSPEYAGLKEYDGQCDGQENTLSIHDDAVSESRRKSGDACSEGGDRTPHRRR